MDIVVWLRSLGLEEYEAAFRDNKINERVLPNLTQEDFVLASFLVRLQLRDFGQEILKHFAGFWPRALLQASQSLLLTGRPIEISALSLACRDRGEIARSNICARTSLRVDRPLY